jgi:FtsH-binding integral membrane protein
MSLTDSARVLYGSPLSRPKNAIVAAIVLVVLLLASTFSLFRVYFSTLSPTAIQVYIMGLFGTFLVTLFPLAILWFLDRREPESRWLYLIALLWGALIASGIAFPVNNIFFKNLGDFVALHPNIKAFWAKMP